jgi:hypothetical protein
MGGMDLDELSKQECKKAIKAREVTMATILEKGE